MTLKKNTYIILVFVGYTTVSFAMENEGTNRVPGAYLRKVGVDPKYVEKAIIDAEQKKTSVQVVDDFYEVPRDVSSDDDEFVKIENNNLSLDDFPENVQKSYPQATASIISSYYNWFTDLKK
jgi:hypothetical protein